METLDLFALGACIAGGLCALLLAYRGCVALLDRIRAQRAVAGSGIEGSSVASLLRGGVRILRRPARLALGSARVRRVVDSLAVGVEAAGYRTDPEALASVVALVLLVTCIALTAASGSPVCGLAAGACVALGLAMWGNRQRDLRREELREQIPEALQSLKSCFQVGYSLPQAIGEVRRSTTGPLGDLFGEMEGVLRTGGGIEDALAVLRRAGTEPELVFLSAALEIQHKTGSSMGHVLEVTRQSVTDEIELKRALRTQTAQAKLSAQIVTVMPFVLIALFSLMSPGFLSPFFESGMGIALLALALGMQAVGIAIVRRFLKVEVG